MQSIKVRIVGEFQPTEKQFEDFARKIYPSVKSYFANEENRKEFELWKEQYLAEKAEHIPDEAI